MPIRLLNTRSLGFQVFRTDDFNINVPRYAVLSHVWDDDDEYVDYIRFSAAFSKGVFPGGRLIPGIQKIVSFCKQAAADGFDYAWADTCCIDKSNISEVSEAINCMFRWYRNAAMCYVYLADVPKTDNPKGPGSAFEKSRWFTRGWTLQELIAPRYLVFYSREWTYLSNKSALKRIIADITKIDEYVLDTGDISSASVSTKLSWVTFRKTTLIEDQAYCLFGIFDIFLPPLYGERERAFQRLLREIARHNSDQTLFSWAGNGQPSGMLASSSSQFAPARDASTVIPTMRNPAFELSNRGIQISLPLLALPLRNLYAMVLNCFPYSDSAKATDSLLVQFVYRMHDDHNAYVRVFNDQEATYPMALKMTHSSLLTTTELFISEPPTPRFTMNNKVVFCLKDYPSDRSHPGLCVLGPSNSVGNFSSMPQSSGQPPLITMKLDDRMPSAVLLFRNDAGQQIAACLTLWGQEIKVGLSTEFVDDDMSRIADAFLFGQSSMVVKQPGSFSVQASPRRGKKVSLILDEPTDHASMGTACNVSLNAANGFWLHAVGPGVWPGCWTRYFDYLATATPVKERTGLFRRKTLEKLAQVMT